MFQFIFSLLLLIAHFTNAQQQTKNIIIIATDGFRWQEVFKGMDSAIANNSTLSHRDSGTILYFQNTEIIAYE